MNRRATNKGERGVIAALAGIFMLVLAGMAVVGVDVGRLAFTASEVQTVAEVAANGYANSWLQNLKSGSDSDALDRSGALGSITGNMIDGQTAGAANIQSYERGVFDIPTSTFAPGGAAADQNAVRATATATVDNFFASLFGTPQTTVVKTATAMLTCPSGARALPLAVGDCYFDAFDGPDDCSDLPTLTQQNVHIDDSCWTSLSTTSSANAQDLKDYLLTICGLGGATFPPPVQEDQSIRVAEGQMTSLCQVLKDCYDAGVREFTVPVVDCASMTTCAAHQTGSLTVKGFASIEIDAPGPTCSGTPKTVPLHAFCNTIPNGEGIGGSCSFGGFETAMIQ